VIVEEIKFLLDSEFADVPDQLYLLHLKSTSISPCQDISRYFEMFPNISSFREVSRGIFPDPLGIKMHTDDVPS